jgi:hypothetical protein
LTVLWILDLDPGSVCFRVVWSRFQFGHDALQVPAAHFVKQRNPVRLDADGIEQQEGWGGTIV